MDVENDLPTAQGTDAENESQQSEQVQEPVQVAPPASEVPAGVQKRLDELTAKFREKERQVEQLMMQQNELLARQALATMPQAVPEEEDDLNPEDKKRLERYIAKTVKPLEEQLAKVNGFLQQQERASVDREVDQRLSKLNNPALAAKVEELMRNWANHPVYRTATKKDAYYIALGMLQDEGVENVSKARDEAGRFQKNAQQQVVTGSPSSRSRAAAPAPVAFEKDISEMSPDELVKYIEEADKQNPEGLLPG